MATKIYSYKRYRISESELQNNQIFADRIVTLGTRIDHIYATNAVRCAIKIY